MGRYPDVSLCNSPSLPLRGGARRGALGWGEGAGARPGVAVPSTRSLVAHGGRRGITSSTAWPPLCSQSLSSASHLHGHHRLLTMSPLLRSCPSSAQNPARASSTSPRKKISSLY